MKQTSILDATVQLSRSLGEVMKRPVPVGGGIKKIAASKSKPKVMKKSAAGKESKSSTLPLFAKKSSDEASAKARVESSIIDMEKITPSEDLPKEQNDTVVIAGDSEKVVAAALEAKEQKTLVKEKSSKTVAEEERALVSQEITAVASDQGVAVSQAEASSPATLGFVELHRLLGNAHEYALGAANAENRRLKKNLAISAAKIRKLESAAKDHADELAKARDGYLETKVVHAQIAQMEEREKKTYAAWEKARDEAVDWRNKYAALEKERLKDPELMMNMLVDVQTRHSTLEKFVLDHCRRILGSNPRVMELDAIQCIEAVTACVIKVIGDVLATLQYLSPTKVVPHDIDAIVACVSELPAVVDWLRRSACRCGATMALSLGIGHFPEDFDVAEVTSGFPSETGEVSKEEVMRLVARAAPYADRVLEMADLDTHQASAIAPEDAEELAPQHKDFATDKPFAATRDKSLTTYPVDKWDAKVVLREFGVVFPGLNDDEAGSSGGK